MQVYCMLRLRHLAEYPSAVRRAEALGFDGITLLELTVSPNLSAVVAAVNSERLSISTGVLVAFPRSPMVVAYDAWSIQSLSKGRFQLGLGSQTRAHLRRRWSTEFLPPMPRMREYVESLHAIWDCWQYGKPLNYQGQYYNFNLMIPYYNPGPIEHPRIPIYLGAINRHMCQLAGQVAEGHLAGDPVTHKWYREMVLPNLEIGAQRAGRKLSDLELTNHGFIGCGKTPADLEKVRQSLREIIALYATTPDYKQVLELHGWQDKASLLVSMAREGKWKEMGTLITDDMLDQYAVVGTPDDLPSKLKQRFAGIVNRIQLDENWISGLSDGDQTKLIAAIKSI